MQHSLGQPDWRFRKQRDGWRAAIRTPRRSCDRPPKRRPGASAAGIFSRLNEYLRRLGLPEERRLSVHGMGYDMVERPLIRQDEDMAIEENMAIVCHPGLFNERMFVHNTDVYLIEPQGPTACLHRTPKEIFEIR